MIHVLTIINRHFSASANLSLASWSTSDSDALARCGHCDNCTRSPDSFVIKDVTLEAWTVLKVAEEARRQAARVTLAALATLVRGSGSIECGKGKHKEKVHLDLDAIAGGKADLTKDVRSTLENFTAYADSTHRMLRLSLWNC